MLRRSFSIAFGGLALALALCSACSTTATVPGAGGSSSGTTTNPTAPSGKVDACKEGCDKMKFFGCNSAAELSACYDDCGKASENQIDVFISCAKNSICDPQCRTSVKPAPAPGAPPPTGGGATPSSCTTACDKLVSCSFIKVSEKAQCVSLCEKDAYQYQIDCINNNECSKMEVACGGTGESSSSSSSSSSSGGATTASQAACEASCTSLHAFSCIDLGQRGQCKTRCAAVDDAERSTFVSCVNGSTGDCVEGKTCYDLL